MQNFVRFHAVEYEKGLSQEFGKTRNSCVLYWATCTQIASLLFLIVYFSYINFYGISSYRNRDQLILKIPVKVWLQRHLLSEFHRKLIGINFLIILIIQNFIEFCGLALELHLLQNCYLKHINTDKHFLEINKTCKCIKNHKSKIFTKAILSSIYTEES